MTPHRKKCPHVVYFNVPRDCFETNSRHPKRYSEGGKNICGCRGLLGREIMLIQQWWHEVIVTLRYFCYLH